MDTAEATTSITAAFWRREVQHDLRFDEFRIMLYMYGYARRMRAHRRFLCADRERK